MATRVAGEQTATCGVGGRGSKAESEHPMTGEARRITYALIYYTEGAIALGSQRNPRWLRRWRGRWRQFRRAGSVVLAAM